METIDLIKIPGDNWSALCSKRKVGFRAKSRAMALYRLQQFIEKCGPESTNSDCSDELLTQTPNPDEALFLLPPRGHYLFYKI